jgi:CheY-like chemotaxis protein
MTAASDAQGLDTAKRSRILLVEDEMMISMLLEDLLESYGYEVVGPASRVSNALGLACSEAIDAGILDLNIAGEEVYPVADALAARGIPFLFVTGYKASAITQKYAERPMLQKPFKPQALKQTLHAILA